MTSFDLSFNVFDMGGITFDGTNFLISSKQFGAISVVDTSGQFLEERFAGDGGGEGGFPAFGFGGGGSRSIAFRTGANQLLTGKNEEISQFEVQGTQIESIDDISTSLTDVQGLTFDTATASDPDDDVIYIASKASDGGGGLVS